MNGTADRVGYSTSVPGSSFILWSWGSCAASFPPSLYLPYLFTHWIPHVRTCLWCICIVPRSNELQFLMQIPGSTVEYIGFTGCTYFILKEWSWWKMILAEAGQADRYVFGMLADVEEMLGFLACLVADLLLPAPPLKISWWPRAKHQWLFMDLLVQERITSVGYCWRWMINSDYTGKTLLGSGPVPSLTWGWPVAKGCSTLKQHGPLGCNYGAHTGKQHLLRNHLNLTGSTSHTPIPHQKLEKWIAGLPAKEEKKQD